MSNELQNKLDAILTDKKENIIPGNLKVGKTCLGVNGTFDFINEEEYPTYEKLSNKILGKIQIPEEYELLDYIESTGEQYLNIGKIENKILYSIQAIGKFTEIEDGLHLEGIYNGSASGVIKMALSFGYNHNDNLDATTYKYIACNYSTGTGPKTTDIIADTNVHKFSVICFDSLVKSLMGEEATRGFYLDDKFVGAGILTAAGSAYYRGPLYIFGSDDGTSIITNKFRVYNYKIWYKGTLDYDLYPVKRKSDGVVGLLNISNSESHLYHQFYTNQGTGEFLYKEL